MTHFEPEAPQNFLLWEATSRDTIDFKKIYVDMTHDLVAGLMLSQIVYWYLPDKNGQSKLRIERDGYRWLVKARHEWWNECRISLEQVKRATRLLITRGLVVTERYKFKGAPTTHIRINWPEFMKRWDEALTNYQSPTDWGERHQSIGGKDTNPIGGKPPNHQGERRQSLTKNTTKTTKKKKTENTTTTVLPSPKEKTENTVGVVDQQLLKDFLIDVGVWDFVVEQIAGSGTTNFEVAATWWAYLLDQKSIEDKPAVLASHLTKGNPPPNLKNHHQRAKLTEIFMEYEYSPDDEDEEED